MANKIRVGLIFGGKSGEHEVSLQSAKSIYEALDKDKYDVQLLGIDKQGAWHLGTGSDFLLNRENPKLISLNKSASQVTPRTSNNQTVLVSTSNNQSAGAVDVFFPIVHGTTGEDGSLQGFLELLNVPYVGAGVLGSAVGMDKAIMKRLLASADLPIAGYIALKKHLITDDIIDQAIKQLKFPIFVKPANLGSSVGVSKAKDKQQLIVSIDTALGYDTKILLEEFIDAREIELSVLGNDDPKVSIPGEINPTHEFYSYEAKYIDEKGATLNIPANLTPEQTTQAQDLALRAFQALDCNGMARVDMFLTKSDAKLYINEINTLPGFTKISMYPKLWEASGITYSELLDQLIELAVQRHHQKQQLKTDFN